MSNNTINKTIIIESDSPVANLLAEATGLSKTVIKDAMTKGAVWSNKSGRSSRLRRAKASLPQGTKVSIYYSDTILKLTPETPTLIEDKQVYSVWNKAVGLMSGGSRFGDHCSINRVVEKSLDRPTFLVHRLDRFVWGLMVLAHTKQAATELSRQFQDRGTEKIYKAVVQGRIETPLSVSESIEGKDALSHITPLQRSEDRTLVEVQIETGRKHQIRRHLSAIGHPIIGDRQYGETEPGGIKLASIVLGFTTPEGEYARYELPEDEQPKL